MEKEDNFCQIGFYYADLEYIKFSNKKKMFKKEKFCISQTKKNVFLYLNSSTTNDFVHTLLLKYAGVLKTGIQIQKN